MPLSAVLFARAIDPDEHRNTAGCEIDKNRKIGGIARGDGHGRASGGSFPRNRNAFLFSRLHQRARGTAAGLGVSRSHLGGKPEQGKEGQQEALSHGAQIGRAESLVQWDRPLQRIYPGRFASANLPNPPARLWRSRKREGLNQ